MLAAKEMWSSSYYNLAWISSCCNPLTVSQDVNTLNQSSVLLVALTSLWSEWWMTGVARQAVGCQRSHGAGTGGERSPLACWYCAGTPASSRAAREMTHNQRKKWKHESWQKRRQKMRAGIWWERAPEQKWEARLVTSEPWECPAWAREVSSSAGCWCSPAVVQPCSLSHPRPASYTEKKWEDNIIVMSISQSHVILSNCH